MTELQTHPETTHKTKRLTKIDLFKVWAIWISCLGGMMNYERMSAVGVCHAMIPVIRRLYVSNEDIVAALKRHLVFFDTDYTAGTIAAGIMASTEEQRANGAPLTDDIINKVKTSLMGPLNGLGSSIFQGMLIPILLALGISMGLEGNIAGPLVYTVLANGISLPLSYWWFKVAYEQGGRIIEQLTESGLLQTAASIVNFIGLMAAGSLTARYVNFRLVSQVLIGGVTIDIQTAVFDKLVPNLLPLAAVLVVWNLLRKGASPNRIILILFVAGFGLGYFNILG
ncbi:MAG: PTS system mannose/fructose/sorbose family transporter subunit IID [Bacillota bacterium]